MIGLEAFLSGSGRIGLPTLGRSGGGWFGGDMPRQFEEMRREMERELAEQFKGIETTAPKDLVREYQTPQGAKVRGVGPLVYGHSITIGQDSKSKVREFGNIRPSSRLGELNSSWTALLFQVRENH
jgi:hypothetical protein